MSDNKYRYLPKADIVRLCVRFLSISEGGLIGSIVTATVGAALLLLVVGIIKKA